MMARVSFVTIGEVRLAAAPEQPCPDSQALFD